MYSYLCVFVLDSTQLYPTQLDWHMKAQPFRFRMRGIRYSNSERMMGERGEGGVWRGGGRPQPVRHFPEDLS